MNRIVYEDIPPWDVGIPGRELSDVQKTVVHENGGIVMGSEIVSAHIDYARNDGRRTVFVSFAVPSRYTEVHVVFRTVEIRIFDVYLRILDNDRISHVRISIHIVVESGILYLISALQVANPPVTICHHAICRSGKLRARTHVYDGVANRNSRSILSLSWMSTARAQSIAVKIDARDVVLQEAYVLEKNISRGLAC